MNILPAATHLVAGSFFERGGGLEVGLVTCPDRGGLVTCPDRGGAGALKISGSPELSQFTLARRIA